MKTALYRHFDAAGRLLYVGISLNTIQRTAQHKHGARWFARIARIDIEWLESRAAALTAEAIAIAKEAPECNVMRPKGARQPQRPPDRGFGVRHTRTGRINGWYARQADAEHMLRWFRAVFPNDRFELAQPTTRSAHVYIDAHLELKPIDSRMWAATEPDYAAGDAVDQEQAA